MNKLAIIMIVFISFIYNLTALADELFVGNAPCLAGQYDKQLTNFMTELKKNIANDKKVLSK